MTNEINLDGSDNILVQGSTNVEIKVTKILSISPDYHALQNELCENQEIFDGLPEDKLTLRLKISKKIDELTNRIEQFKREIIQLAETFDKLQVNSERLQQAREFFEKGEIGEARALLNDDNEQIAAEEAQLWHKRDYYETEIEPKLIAKSEERYIQALLSQTDYDNPNWFADTCNYFELSIKSYPTKDNHFQYALFLQEHNQFPDAEKYYSKYLNDFSTQISKNEYADTLHNLAVLHKNQKRYDEALAEYEESLAIYRNLTEKSPNTYLPYVATTLNNLAVFHKIQSRYDESLSEYEEALAIRRNLAETDPNTYLPYVAMTLNNLALLHETQNQYEEALTEYEEVLAIYRNLAETNPNSYLPYVAITLNNFAGLHLAKNELPETIEKATKSTNIYRELAINNFQTYFPDLARNLSNLAFFYQDFVPQRDVSIEYAIETIIILSPYVEKVPFSQENFEKAINVLRKWNLSNEEIERMIAEKMKENE